MDHDEGDKHMYCGGNAKTCHYTDWRHCCRVLCFGSGGRHTFEVDVGCGLCNSSVTFPMRLMGNSDSETMKIEEDARRKSLSFFKADQAIENGV